MRFLRFRLGVALFNIESLFQICTVCVYATAELQKLNAAVLAGLNNIIGPDRTLNLTDVCLSKEEHADS